ncbi:Acyl-CoA dehydrogenase family member 11 [Tetrabaena socialis]|uniref:Acyl-CoA dehydrogenase family member 11 n=1 Tax=Tetrabaena socialis TaxID=47790 RepID=A0A2J7ZY18_9CHLO|nr:Acyl-CoA dehydrogenase family member 11 [Tetrabaena socialis]|eukprot:PNH05161.1 Acyl-CoA dehydrogenase family member 11 [Tetrabaena socialis]
MSFMTMQSAGPVRGGHALDLPALEAYLRQQLPHLFAPGPADAPPGLRAQQFAHGQSNPTFLLTLPSGARLVLRKKPPGVLLASAHAVEREYAVLAALSSASFPAPRAVHLCASDAPLGTPFYLMESAQGRIFLDPCLPELAPAERGAVYRQMAQRTRSRSHLRCVRRSAALHGNTNDGPHPSPALQQTGATTSACASARTRPAS